MVKLSRCRRSEGDMLFEIYCKPPSITELRSLLPARAPYADVNLCVSHKFRTRLISKIQRDRWDAGGFLNAKTFIGDRRWPHSQRLTVAEGDWLLAQKTIPSAGLCNGAFVCVRTVENEENEIEVYDPQSQAIAKVPHSRFAECFLSASCVSYQVTQGKTIGFGTVGLWQTQHRFFTPKHLRVGLSRATAISDVYVY